MCHKRWKNEGTAKSCEKEWGFFLIERLVIKYFSAFFSRISCVLFTVNQKRRFELLKKFCINQYNEYENTVVSHRKLEVNVGDKLRSP